MKPAVFAYHDPASLEEALSLMSEYGDQARPLAGGQSLVPLMNFRLLRPAHVIDLNRIGELNYLKSENGGLRIGATARQRQLERSSEVTPAMAAPKLIFAGVLEECSEIRLVWSHCGGSLGMMIDRIDRGYKRYESCPRPLSEYLRCCFYDTASMHGPALDCARATFGTNALVYGTDEPHVPNGTRAVLDALQSRRWPETIWQRFSFAMPGACSAHRFIAGRPTTK